MLFYAQKMPKKDLAAHASQYCTHDSRTAVRTFLASIPSTTGTRIFESTFKYYLVLNTWELQIIFFFVLIGPGWKCVHDTELDQSFSELVGSPPGNENSKSYELPRPSWGKLVRGY